MTIRYKCEECSSVLKIKEELIGTEGKCPKCKTKFIVPDSGDHEEPSPKDSSPKKKSKSAETAKAKKPKKSPAVEKVQPVPVTEKAPADDEEFDPTDILFGTDDDDEVGVTPSASEQSSDDDEPVDDVFDAFDDDDELTAPPAMTPAPQTADSPTSATAADLLARKSGKSPSVSGQSYGSAMAAVSSSVEKSLRSKDDNPKKKVQPRLKSEGGEWEKQFILTRVLPAVAGVLVVCSLGYWVMMDRANVPPLHYVSGTVMLDGRPLSGATVEFFPVGADREGQVANSSGTTDANGEYVLFYVDGYKGAVEGQFIVTINSDFDFIPPDYTDFPTDHIREVTGTSEFNFDLTSN